MVNCQWLCRVPAIVDEYPHGATCYRHSSPWGDVLCGRIRYAPTRDTDTKMPGTSKWIPGTIRARICSAGRRGQNQGCEFVQRVVVAKIAGANLFSGSSRPKSRVRIRSAARRGQNRGCEFVQRLVAAKIGGTFDGAYAVAPLQAAGSTINHCKGEPLLPERDLPHCP